MTHARILSALVALSLLAPMPALAQSDADMATARALAGEGQDALDKQDFATAEDRFRRADTLYHAPTLELGLARAHVGLRHFVTAHEIYERIVREGVPKGSRNDAFKAAVDDAKKELDQVSRQLAWVTIQVTGPSAPEVTIDGVALAPAALGVKRAIDPGQHVVRATGDGYGAAEKQLTIAEGGAEKLTFALEPGAAPTAPVATATAPTPAPDAPTTAPRSSMQRTLGFVALGVGGAGLALGAVTGILAIGKHGSLSDACKDGVCPPSSQGDLDGYHTVGTLSTIGFIAGGVGLGAGVVLLLTAPKAAPQKEAAFTPLVGLGSVGARGRF
jgi:hypothetical protein